MRYESLQGIWREEQILEAKLWQILEYISLNEKTSKIFLNQKNQNTQNPSEEESPLCQQINDQYLINIKEVFAGNESYPAFVELYFLDDPKDISQLKLSWPMFDHEVIFYKDEELLGKVKNNST